MKCNQNIRLSIPSLWSRDHNFNLYTLRALWKQLIHSSCLVHYQNKQDSAQAQVPELNHSMSNYNSFSLASFEEDSLGKLVANTKGRKKNTKGCGTDWMMLEVFSNLKQSITPCCKCCAYMHRCACMGD